VIRNKNKAYVWSNELGKGKYYDTVYNVNFSLNGNSIAYTTKRKNQIFVVVNGKELGPYSAMPFDTVVFSSDGKRFAFPAENSKGRDDFNPFMVVDGIKQPEFDEIGIDGIEFSPNSDHFIYNAKDFEGTFVLYDGAKGPVFEEIRAEPSQFSKDGSIVYYYGIRNGKSYIVINNTIFSDYFDHSEIVVSASTNDIAYGAVKDSGDNWQVYSNHRPINKYFTSRFPIFCSSGKRFAYWASDGAVQFAVVDGVEDKRFNEISDIRFTADCNHYYYIVFLKEAPKTWAFVADGLLLREMHGRLKNPHIYFSGTGSSLAYIWDVDSLNETLIVNEREYQAVQFGDLVFSPDGIRFGVIRKKSIDDNWQLIVDGEEISHEDFIGPNIAFSLDSRDIAYHAYGNNGRRLFVNDQEFETFRNTFPMKVKFNQNGEILFYAFEDKNFYRVTVKPQ
jgi:hypothetical protein